MKIGIQAMGLVAMAALGASILGCSPTPVSTAPSSNQGEAATTSQPDKTVANQKAADMTSPGKAAAPVKTTLKSSGTTGTVELTLTVEALADIPRGVGRIVLPEHGRTPQGEIKVLKGNLEVDFGAVPRGEKRELQVTLEVPPSAKLQVFAGVDCHMTSGILMHKPAQPVVLGQ